MIPIKHCWYCGHRLSRKNHTLDHVNPLCKGGKDKKWNKVDACNTCNQEKGCLTADEFRAVLAFRAANYKDKSIFWIEFHGEKKMNDLFDGRQLNVKGFARVQNIGSAFDTLLSVIEAAVPEGRQLSIVKTKLEEACFYAKKGVALQQEYQADAK